MLSRQIQQKHNLFHTFLNLYMFFSELLGTLKAEYLF